MPSIFPNLATGWVTAAGGAWNASVVAEYLVYRGKILKTGGLGSTISVATSNEDFTLLAASLTLMVVVVIFLNRAGATGVTKWEQTAKLFQNGPNGSTPLTEACQKAFSRAKDKPLLVLIATGMFERAGVIVGVVSSLCPMKMVCQTISEPSPSSSQREILPVLLSAF